VHGRLQIVYGLLTSKEGIPVAIAVCNGNTGDPNDPTAWTCPRRTYKRDH
jgi:transposase